MRTNSDLIVIATAKAQPGKEDALERALRDVAEPTRAQPGCVEWTLFRAGSTLVALERWTSRETHDRHMKGAHAQKLVAQMGPLLAEPPSIVEHAIVDERVTSSAPSAR